MLPTLTGRQSLLSTLALTAHQILYSFHDKGLQEGEIDVGIAVLRNDILENGAHRGREGRLDAVSPQFSPGSLVAAGEEY